MNTIDFPPPRQPRRRGRLLLLALVALLVIGSGTTLSYYVDSLWFDSLGFREVFWRMLRLQSEIFLLFGLATFFALYGAFLALRPADLELGTSNILINGQPLKLPVGPALRVIALVACAFLALVTGLGMMAQWNTFALYLHQPASSGTLDPIFGRPVTFYLFTLPVWQVVAGWLTTLAVIVVIAASVFAAAAGGIRAMRRGGKDPSTLRGVSIAAAMALLALAAQTYVGRFDRLLDDHTIFAGVTYTDAHVLVTGMLVVSVALVLGAVACAINAVAAPRLRWIVAAVVPAAAIYLIVGVIAWYVNGFVVKPNELARERPFITNNIEATQAAFALDRITQVPFPAEAGIAAVDAENNRETLEILYKGRHIAEVLEMTVEEAHGFFSAVPAIARKLQTLLDVGLGYVRLGQSATTLSGGEAQRVKLALELSKRDTGRTLYILDEPTTGLHFHDIGLLLTVLHQLRDAGNTIVVIEHNLDVIKTADWVVDMGPEGGAGGGRVVVAGTPEEVAAFEGSHTGRFLRPLLQGAAEPQPA